MDKWEYMSIKTETKGFTGGILDIGSFDSKLNSMGERGWELVSCLTTNAGYGATREVVAVFKRRRQCD